MAETTPATRGWLHNQVGIRVSDLAKSTFFYETILGMQVLARIESDSLALVLMGYPEGGGPEKMLSREGVLELSYSEHTKKSPTNGSQHPQCGVLKLAFSVPDLSACVSRLKEHGVQILKEAGTSDGGEEVAQALGFESPNEGRNKGVWEFIQGVAFARDPDGYILELIQY